MAKLKALPSLEVINVLKGTLDYYYWKGIPCVRKWPHIPHSSRTQPSLDSAHLFGVIVQGWALVGATAKALYAEAAADQPRTGRDLYVSGVLGGQHEASMSDFLDLLTECKDYLAALQALLGPLGSVDTDDLQIDIKSALTTLPVRGMDQLFSYASRYFQRGSIPDAVAGDNDVLGSIVPGGQVWIVTAAGAMDETTPCTTIAVGLIAAGIGALFSGRANPAANEVVPCNHVMVLTPGDRAYAHFTGVTLHDTLRLALDGYKMTLET